MAHEFETDPLPKFSAPSLRPQVAEITQRKAEIKRATGARHLFPSRPYDAVLNGSGR